LIQLTLLTNWFSVCVFFSGPLEFVASARSISYPIAFFYATPRLDPFILPLGSEGCVGTSDCRLSPYASSSFFEFSSTHYFFLFHYFLAPTPRLRSFVLFFLQPPGFYVRRILPLLWCPGNSTHGIPPFCLLPGNPSFSKSFFFSCDFSFPGSKNPVSRENVFPFSYSLLISRIPDASQFPSVRFFSPTQSTSLFLETPLSDKDVVCYYPPFQAPQVRTDNSFFPPPQF